jgi:uncharacterized repeat protein (TIGR03803 family)
MILLAFALPTLTAPPAQAQTYSILYNFTGGADGEGPYAGVTLDGAGNLYGTTTASYGGNGGGTVYKLTHRSGGWTFTRLYNSGSYGGVTIGPNGTFYGINAYSEVFDLQPPPHFVPNLFAPWLETTLYSLAAGSYAGVVFDRAGNIYGTTYDGGSYEGGSVFELSPSNGGWTETVIHSFGNGFDGSFPIAGLVIDAAGNLYGTTQSGGGYENGTVYELSPSAGGWTENLLHSFTGGEDGGDPYGGLIFDSAGNLYGATPGTYSGGQGGSVFKLTPSGDGWTFSVIYSFTEGGDECGPRGTPAMDAAGNIYDTTTCAPDNVFKLTPINGGWTYSSLHEFDERGDGYYPEAGVTLDANGNIYGTTTGGGAYNNGIVFEITP